jgi:hypothetical protein
MDESNIPSAPPQIRFKLSDLFHFITVCSVLLACHPLTGVASAVLLAAMALALTARFGLLAAILLAAALATSGSSNGVREIATLSIGIAVIGWFRLQRWRADQAAYRAWIMTKREAFPRTREEPWLAKF